MSTPTPTRRTLASTGILLLLIVGALWLRLLNLGSQSLWWDEANTYQAMNGSLLQAFDSITNDILSLPLDNLFLVLCAEGSPPDEFLFRLPAALFGVLCVPLTYVFARDLWGRRAGLVAAGLIAFSPYHIRYSQEARYYTSFAALHLLSLITLSRAIHVPSRRRWGVYAVATAIMFYDQVFGFVAAGAQLALHGLYTTARAFSPMIRRWTNRPLPSGKSVHLRSVWFHGLALVGATLLLLPWGLIVWLSRGIASNLVSEVGTLRGYHALVIDANNYLGMLKWFVNNSGSTSFLFIAFCAMIIVALLVGRDGRRRAAWMTLAYCFVITTVLLVASHLTNVWAAYRRFLFLQPLLFALVAAGVIQIVDGAKAWLRRHGRPLHPGADAALIVLCLVVVAALWAPAIQAHYADEKEDWRELSQILLEEATPDDLIVNLAVGYQSERALRAYLGPDYGGLHIISPAIVVDSEDELALNEKMRIWMIYPIPLDVADATHRTLNDPEHLRTLDIPPRTYSPPFESLLALEGPTPAPATRDELRAWIVEGLERTALTDEPIFSGWRSNALNVLLTAYERAGDVAKVYEVYRQAPLLPGMAEDVKANMDDVAAYLEKRLTAADGVIAGSYWDDPMIRDAVAEALQSHGYMAAEELDRGALEQITRRLYDEWPGDDATRFEFEGDAWREQWESQLFLGEATTAPVPATGDDGTGETPSTCLLITTAGSGYRGAISREMKVEPGKLYLLGLVMQRESELGLQGKALYLTYPQGAGQRGAYASAWWGSAASEVFVALFAAPAGVEQITFSPVLIDNAGAVCLRSGFVASIAGDP